MPPTSPPLNEALPPLIFGTATFNSQYNADPFAMPTNAIVERALSLGIRAFDTSPYYGPSEQLLGAALTTPTVLASHPRESYTLITKVGRIGGSEFDYSPEWVRYSIQTSLQRLRTNYLDLVYCHDVEFVTPNEVLCAVRELRRIRDTQGTVSYVGISGYPVDELCALAELVLRETGEPLDAVMSYANLTLQNSALESRGIERLARAGVRVVPNASPLGMGLLRGVGVPVGGKGDFHPAPCALRERVAVAARLIESTGEKLETISIRWALERWARAGRSVGGKGAVGVSVMGVSKIEELEETMSVWGSVLDGLDGSTAAEESKIWSWERRKEIERKAEMVWRVLGEWKDFAWASPGAGYVNMRNVKGAVDEVDRLESLSEKHQERVAKDSRL